MLFHVILLRPGRRKPDLTYPTPRELLQSEPSHGVVVFVYSGDAV